MEKTKGGRPHLDGSRPGDGEYTITKCITITPEMAEQLKAIGGGNVSKGVRMVTEHYQKEKCKMFSIEVNHEDSNGQESGYGIYVNAYVTWDDEGVPIRYASECIPFGKNTPKNLKDAEKRVRRQARERAKKDCMGESH